MPTAAADIAHLCRRAEFGASPARVAQLAALDRDAAVEAVLATSSAPADVRPAFLDQGDLEEWQKIFMLVQWWLDRMATSATPLVEKMTLFWHGHFVSGSEKVYDGDYLYRQNRLYRSLALGDLRQLTQAMAVEPAMLQYLDNDRNRIGQPNENFARELMELFTIGVGHYSEDDVKASARAWTGHGLDWDGRRYVFRSSWHDSGAKTFMGITKDWDGPDIIDHLLGSPTTKPLAARFLARKLWLFFAGPEPAPATLDQLAAAYADRWSTTDLLRALFTHPDFWSAEVRQGLVRSPVDYAVAIMRATGLDAGAANPQWWLRQMGQIPFDPPNVSGWRTNGYWISTSATAARADFARYVTWRARETGLLDEALTASPTDAVQLAFDTFSVDRATDRTRARLERWVADQRTGYQGWAVAPNLLTLVPLTPEFQLA